MRLAVAVALGLSALAFAAPSSGQQADEGVEARGRFEEGLVHFRANDMGKAIDVWAPIVDQMGDVRAYRLLFNLGIAHQALGDATRAADHYERFLAQLEARASGGLGVPPDVLSFGEQARERLRALQAKYGRVRVSNDRGLLVAVRVGGASGSSGRTYYLAPGTYEVVLRAGAGASAGEERRKIEVRAGEIVDITPKPLPEAPPRVILSSPPPREPPYSPWVVAIAGGVTLASGVVPLILRNAAVGVAERYYDPTTPVAERERVASDYDAAKTRYEWSFALPAALAAGTGALAIYYFAGSKPRRPAQVGLWPGGPQGSIGLSVGGAMPN